MPEFCCCRNSISYWIKLNLGLSSLSLLPRLLFSPIQHRIKDWNSDCKSRVIQLIIMLECFYTSLDKTCLCLNNTRYFLISVKQIPIFEWLYGEVFLIYSYNHWEGSQYKDNSFTIWLQILSCVLYKSSFQTKHFHP